MFNIQEKHSWFTLVEIMIVVTIIMILFGMSILPYGYYMDRAYLERTTDAIGQEWILSHKQVRNGISFTSGNANTIFIFEKWSWEIKRYRTTSGTDTLLSPFPEKSCRENLTSSDIACVDTPIVLDKNILILGFSGGSVDLAWEDFLGYTIFAPSASGGFFTGSRLFSPDTWVSLTIGYTLSDIDGPRSRHMLLTPYLR